MFKWILFFLCLSLLCNIMIALPHMSFLGVWNRRNSWAVRMCHFCKRKHNWLQRLSEDPPETLPAPLLLWDQLLSSRWGWLFDLLKIYQVGLPSCPWPSKVRGGAATVWGKWAFGDLRGQEVDKRLCWLCRSTALADCQQRECIIICSKLLAHTKWHKAA